jgi:hypothetical protein
MLSSVCDHSTRTLKPDTWEHVTLKLLRCYAGVDIIDHALGEDAGADNYRLARNPAGNLFNVGAIRPIDLFHDNLGGGEGAPISYRHRMSLVQLRSAHHSLGESG